MFIVKITKIKQGDIDMKDSILYGNKGVFRYFSSDSRETFTKTVSAFLAKLAFGSNPVNDNSIPYCPSVKESVTQKNINQDAGSSLYAISSNIQGISYEFNKNSEDMDLVDLIKYEIELRKEVCQIDKNVRLEFDCDLKECNVHFTKQHMKFVVSNLIDNAIKHSGDNLFIVSLKFVRDFQGVQCTNYREECNYDRVYMTIRDYGVSVESECDDRSFKQKGRNSLKNAIAQSIEEKVKAFDKMALSGFSLSVIKTIMQLHDTKIWVRDNSDMDINCGSVFEFSLPVQKNNL